MEKFLYVTNTSSVLPSAKRLGKPPSPTGEGFCKSRFWATDGCAAVTDTTLDRRQLVAGTHGPYKQKKITIALLVIDGTNDFYLVVMGGACSSRDIGHLIPQTLAAKCVNVVEFFRDLWYNYPK